MVKSIPQAHRLSSLGKPRDAKTAILGDGLFYPTLVLMTDSHNYEFEVGRITVRVGGSL